MYYPRFSPGDRVQLLSNHAIGTVISAYAIVVPWYEVQLDDHSVPHIFSEDELAPAPAVLKRPVCEGSAGVARPIALWASAGGVAVASCTAPDLETLSIHTRVFD